MILDNFDSVGRYAAALPGLGEAIDFARGAGGLAAGRYELAGGAYALVQEYETAGPESISWEAHRAYADVQIMLEGEESVGWAAGLVASGAFDEAKDIVLAPAAEGVSELALRPSLFVLFLPGEAHRPRARLGARAKVRKLVVKLPLGD